MRERGAGGEVQQCAVRLATMVLTPRAFPREGGEVKAGYVIVMSLVCRSVTDEIQLSRCVNARLPVFFMEWSPSG